MNKKKKCKIGLLLTIKLEIRGLYVVIRPMPFENASEKFPRSSFNIFAGCLLDKLGLAFWIRFFNQTLYLLYVSGKNSADGISKMRAVQ